MSKSWSIHSRGEIISKYEILERVGSGAYSDVYRGRRLSDGLTVALKEVHDYQSAFREIEALRSLHNSPNVVVLLDYFCREEEDAVLVLEFLRTDLATVVKEARKTGGLAAGEAKRWMVQILSGLDACHRSMIVHRDLKPSNLLISEHGVLKIADFGQARILLESPFTTANDNPHPYELNADKMRTFQPHELVPETDSPAHRDDHVRELDDSRFKDTIEDTDKESNPPDGDASCLATCTTSEFEDDPLKGSYSYEAEEGGENPGSLTSCVGTRWYRAPELLYGSTDYGLEIDLWSLGCIFAELLILEPLFPGASDIDQLGRIFSVLGNLTETSWPGCVHLPDYRMISFNKVENPTGIELCLPKCSPNGISLVKKLVCYDPANRATPMELLQDKYFNEQPLPVPISELGVPMTKDGQDEDYPGGFHEYKDDSDSDFDELFPVNVTTTSTGFSIKFPEQ